MFIPDPDLQLSRISDPKTGTKEKGEKKIFLDIRIAKIMLIRIRNPS
jgi:hypothetical protein